MLMRVAALFSGGKDSVFALYITKQYGWEVTHLVTLLPDKTDSWMFHSINIQYTDMLAQALGIPLVKRTTTAEKETELHDLQALLQGLEVDGVISGAIASEYQRTRIEKICDELGIKSFTPLWHKNQTLLLKDQLNAGFDIIIVGVFAEGFNDTWLGKSINETTIDDIVRLNKKHGISIAGEGGEYETLVLSGPLFSQMLVIDDSVQVWHRDSGALLVTKSHLEDYP
jgi:ABC transporter with metal-binding/Fe-S-binding domain ATP-binding protein